MGAEDACHFLGRRLSFAVTQPHVTALRTNHKLLRLHTHTHTNLPAVNTVTASAFRAAAILTILVGGVA